MYVQNEQNMNRVTQARGLTCMLFCHLVHIEEYQCAETIIEFNTFELNPWGDSVLVSEWHKLTCKNI